jgi:hypothetical protein
MTSGAGAHMLTRIVVGSFLLTSFLAGSLAAQTGPSPSSDTWPPLRADEITEDTAENRVVLRGRMDFPDGRTETSVVIVCNRTHRYLAVTNFAATTDDRYGVDASVCDALARVPRGQSR